MVGGVVEYNFCNLVLFGKKFTYRLLAETIPEMDPRTVPWPLAPNVHSTVPYLLASSIAMSNPACLGKKAGQKTWCRPI
jgi:hypothetical protein